MWATHSVQPKGLLWATPLESSTAGPWVQMLELPSVSQLGSLTVLQLDCLLGWQWAPMWATHSVQPKGLLWATPSESSTAGPWVQMLELP
jgi:hypothetical protein